MKKNILYSIAIGLLAMVTIPAMAQTDVLNPDRTNTLSDPKITNDDSKVLIDTTHNIVDSLLDANKTGRYKTHQNSQPMGKSNKPCKTKKAYSDSTKIVKP